MNIKENKLERQRGRVKFAKIDFVARALDVDADDVILAVKIENDSRPDLLRFRTGTGHKLDVQGIGLPIVLEPYGLNLRSKNALWIAVG